MILKGTGQFYGRYRGRLGNAWNLPRRDADVPLEFLAIAFQFNFFYLHKYTIHNVCCTKVRDIMKNLSEWQGLVSPKQGLSITRESSKSLLKLTKSFILSLLKGPKFSRTKSWNKSFSCPVSFPTQDSSSVDKISSIFLGLVLF